MDMALPDPVCRGRAGLLASEERCSSPRPVISDRPAGVGRSQPPCFVSAAREFALGPPSANTTRAIIALRHRFRSDPECDCRVQGRWTKTIHRSVFLAIAGLSDTSKPGDRLAFLEPNRGRAGTGLTGPVRTLGRSVEPARGLGRGGGSCTGPVFSDPWLREDAQLSAVAQSGARSTRGLGSHFHSKERGVSVSGCRPGSVPWSFPRQSATRGL